MPLTNSYNATATSNEQPEYQNLWEPSGILTTSSNQTSAFTTGAALMYTNAGIGANPGPGGDAGSGTAYTVQTVDIAATTSTLWFAGILLGVGALGQALSTTEFPGTVTSNGSTIGGQQLMVGKKGITQALFDSTTTVGHTFIVSTTVAGAFHDTAGTAITYGTTVGVILQAVTISSGTALVWVKYSAW